MTSRMIAAVHEELIRGIDDPEFGRDPTEFSRALIAAVFDNLDREAMARAIFEALIAVKNQDGAWEHLSPLGRATGMLLADAAIAAARAAALGDAT